MAQIKLKPEFVKHENGFLGKYGPMGERSQDDLRKFIAQAQFHNIQSDLDMFEEIPDAEEDKEEKAKELAAHSKGKHLTVKEKAAQAATKLAKQTPDTKEEAELNHIAATAAPGPVSTTNATDGTAIAP